MAIETQHKFHVSWFSLTFSIHCCGIFIMDWSSGKFRGQGTMSNVARSIGQDGHQKLLDKFNPLSLSD